MSLPTVTWVIKLSKLCNMRCSYCYEWNSLSNPSRMSAGTWRTVLESIVEHTRLRRARLRTSSLQRPRMRVVIVFHGGEPFVLPEAYIKEILETFADVTRNEPDLYQLSLQTNGLSVPESKLQLFLEHGTQLSVSFDKKPGVRLNVAGQATEATVAANIDRLLERGLRLHGICVLAKHTAPHVTEVYDFYAARGMNMRILPLFDGPDERPTDDFMIDHPHIVGALDRLFRHWLETGCRVNVSPLRTHFEATLRHMAGLSVPTWRRSERGDTVFLVNLDAKVYRVLDAYQEDLALGDLSVQSVRELLGSPSYRQSLERDEQDFASKCRSCKYLGACSGAFIHDSRTSSHSGNCSTAQPCIEFMQRYIEEQGFDRADITRLLEHVTRQRQSAAA